MRSLKDLVLFLLADRHQLQGQLLAERQARYRLERDFILLLVFILVALNR